MGIGNISLLFILLLIFSFTPVGDHTEDKFKRPSIRIRKLIAEYNHGYIPCTTAVFIILFFCVAARLSYSWDYVYRKEGGVIILENKVTCKKSHLYLLTIDTGMWYKSGSSAHTRIEIHAHNYCSRVYCLRPRGPCSKILRRGHRDIFVLKTSDCLGEVFSITLLMLTQTKRSTWYLETITLVDVSHQRTWTFPCHRWLSTYGKPSQVVKLFPSEFPYRKWWYLLESRWAEFHTWVSLFCHYNRLGRFTRIERVAICCNTLMTILFTYLIILFILGSGFFPKQGSHTYSAEMVRFIIICICVILISILISYIPEFFLRVSLPLGTTVAYFGQVLHENVCTDCIIGQKKGDMAIMPNTDPILLAKHCPLECEVCLEDIGKKKRKKDGLNTTERKIVDNITSARTCKDSLFSPGKASDAKSATKYYDLAEQYLRFFIAWNAFCDKFSSAAGQLKGHMEKYGNERNVKHTQVFHWLMGAMDEVYQKNGIKSKKKNLEETVSISELFQDNENRIILPVRGVIDNFKTISFDGKNFLRLIRVTALLLLVITVKHLDAFNAICIKSLHRLRNDVASNLHHKVYTLLLVMHCLILEKDQLCEVCDGAIIKRIDCIEDFLNEYLQKKNICDFDAASNVLIIIEDKPLKGARSDKNLNRPNNPSRKSSLTDLSKKHGSCKFAIIRDRLMFFTKNIISDIVKGIVIVNTNRKPMHNFHDFMKFHCTSQDPQSWATACMEFMTPLMASIIHPLIKHSCHFLKKNDHCSHHHLVQQYLQTVVINAAFLVVKNFSLSELEEIWLHDQIQADESQYYNCGEPIVDYAALVDQFKECLVHTEIINVYLECNCNEGKLHVKDKALLLRLLEEEKVKSNQLACPRTIRMMVSLIEGYAKRLENIQNFLSQSALMLTDSQDLISDLPEGEEAIFVRCFRQQLLDMSFLVMKLIEKCEDATRFSRSKMPIPPDSPTYWMRPGYGEMRWVKSVSKYKEYLVPESTEIPFSVCELKVIEAFAFGIMDSFLPPSWTMIIYIYLFLQNMAFLAFFVAISHTLEYLEALGSLIAVIVGMSLEIIIIQPLKAFILCFYISRYKHKKTLIKAARIEACAKQQA